MSMSPLFKLGEERLANLAGENVRAPNILTFTKDKTTRRREAERLKAYRRLALIDALMNGAA